MKELHPELSAWSRAKRVFSDISAKGKGLSDEETEILRWNLSKVDCTTQLKRPRALHSTAFSEGTPISAVVIHNQEELNSSSGT